MKFKTENDLGTITYRIMDSKGKDLIWIRPFDKSIILYQNRWRILRNRKFSKRVRK